MTDDKFEKWVPGTKYVPSPRTVYSGELEREIAPKVWLGLSGNGSLRINIDTDVQCYGDWNPYGTHSLETEEDRVLYAQSWVAYFVRSTINRLIDRGDLKVPEED